MKEWARKQLEECCNAIKSDARVEIVGEEAVITSNGSVLVRMRNTPFAVEVADSSGRHWQPAWGPESASDAIAQALSCGGIRV